MARKSRKSNLIKNEPKQLTAIYARLSNEKKDTESIENQLLITKGFASRNKISNLIEFVDKGYTGTNFNRPGFNDMMAKVKSGLITTIIVKDLSRFGRNHVEVGNYVETILPKLGVRFISVNDGIDTNDKENFMIISLRNIVNEEYAKDISKKVKAAHKTKFKTGTYIGSTPPYGYNVGFTDKRTLVIDDYSSRIVKRIFDLYTNGKGIRTIQKIIQKERILSPTVYRRKQQGKDISNMESFWYDTVIKRILGNPVYLGHMVRRTETKYINGFKKVRMKKKDWKYVYNTHQSIIDEDIFNKVQLKLSRKNVSYQRVIATKTSVLEGMVYSTQYNTVLSSYKTKQRIYFYVPESKRKNLQRLVISEVRLLQEINIWITNEINMIVDFNNLLQTLIQSISFIEAYKSYQLKIKQVKLKIKHEREKLFELYSDYKENLIDEEQFNIKKDNIDSKVANLEDKQIDLQDILDEFKTINTIDLSNFILSKNNINRLIPLVIDRIEYDDIDGVKRINIISKLSDIKQKYINVRGIVNENS